LIIPFGVLIHRDSKDEGMEFQSEQDCVRSKELTVLWQKELCVHKMLNAQSIGVMLVCRNALYTQW